MSSVQGQSDVKVHSDGESQSSENVQDQNFFLFFVAEVVTAETPLIAEAPSLRNIPQTFQKQESHFSENTVPLSS